MHPNFNLIFIFRNLRRGMSSLRTQSKKKKKTTAVLYSSTRYSPYPTAALQAPALRASHTVQDAMDDFRSRRVHAAAGAIPSTSDFQKAKHASLLLLPVADLLSRKIETMSKSLFRGFQPQSLVDKFAGSGVFERALLLQTRLLIMLQVIVGMI